jgi:hypothetical protein
VPATAYRPVANVGNLARLVTVVTGGAGERLAAIAILARFRALVLP